VVDVDDVPAAGLELGLVELVEARRAHEDELEAERAMSCCLVEVSE
jgi:hypothetical protein